MPKKYGIPKLDATYTIRIPAHIKEVAESLPINDIHALTEHMRTEYAKFVLNKVVNASTERILSDPDSFKVIMTTLRPKKESG